MLRHNNLQSKKRSLQSYTIAEKIEMVKKFKQGNQSAREFARNNNLGKSTILNWMKEDENGNFDNVKNTALKKKDYLYIPRSKTN